MYVLVCLAGAIPVTRVSEGFAAASADYHCSNWYGWSLFLPSLFLPAGYGQRKEGTIVEPRQPSGGDPTPSQIYISTRTTI